MASPPDKQLSGFSVGWPDEHAFEVAMVVVSG